MGDERTPTRERVGRSARKNRAVTSGFEWLSPDQVPGGVLSGEAQRRLQQKLREIDECQARARVTGASYVIYR